MDELNHRVKNTLVTVQAMAEQTLRKSRDPAHFVELAVPVPRPKPWRSGLSDP
jgi:two-component sensor histidine kinase